MQNVELKAVLTGVRPGGCVQPYLMGFAAELIAAGYSFAFGPRLHAVGRAFGPMDGFP